MDLLKASLEEFFKVIPGAASEETNRNLIEQKRIPTE